MRQVCIEIFLHRKYLKPFILKCRVPVFQLVLKSKKFSIFVKYLYRIFAQSENMPNYGFISSAKMPRECQCKSFG